MQERKQAFGSIIYLQYINTKPQCLSLTYCKRMTTKSLVKLQTNSHGTTTNQTAPFKHNLSPLLETIADGGGVVHPTHPNNVSIIRGHDACGRKTTSRRAVTHINTTTKHHRHYLRGRLECTSNATWTRPSY